MSRGDTSTPLPLYVTPPASPCASSSLSSSFSNTAISAASPALQFARRATTKLTSSLSVDALFSPIRDRVSSDPVLPLYHRQSPSPGPVNSTNTHATAVNGSDDAHLDGFTIDTLPVGVPRSPSVLSVRSNASNSAVGVHPSLALSPANSMPSPSALSAPRLRTMSPFHLAAPNRVVSDRSPLPSSRIETSFRSHTPLPSPSPLEAVYESPVGSLSVSSPSSLPLPSSAVIANNSFPVLRRAVSDHSALYRSHNYQGATNPLPLSSSSSASTTRNGNSFFLDRKEDNSRDRNSLQSVLHARSPDRFTASASTSPCLSTVSSSSSSPASSPSSRGSLSSSTLSVANKKLAASSVSSSPSSSSASSTKGLRYLMFCVQSTTLSVILFMCALLLLMAVDMYLSAGSVPFTTPQINSLPSSTRNTLSVINDPYFHVGSLAGPAPASRVLLSNSQPATAVNSMTPPVSPEKASLDVTSSSLNRPPTQCSAGCQVCRKDCLDTKLRCIAPCFRPQATPVDVCQQQCRIDFGYCHDSCDWIVT